MAAYEGRQQRYDSSFILQHFINVTWSLCFGLTFKIAQGIFLSCSEQLVFHMRGKERKESNKQLITIQNIPLITFDYTRDNSDFDILWSLIIHASRTTSGTSELSLTC